MSYLVNGVKASDYFPDRAIPDIDITGTDDPEVVSRLTEAALYAASGMYGGGRHILAVSFDDHEVAELVFSDSVSEGRYTRAYLDLRTWRFVVVSVDKGAKAEIKAALPDTWETRYMINELSEMDKSHPCSYDFHSI